MEKAEQNILKTPGLLKYDSYKDSGVEWLGEMPEHWEIKRFRDNFTLGKGLTITKENLCDEGIFCVNYGEIHSKYGFEVNPGIHKLRCVSEEYLVKSSNSLVYKGDFIFADTSEDIYGSGNFTCVWGDNKVFAGYHTIIARPKNELNSRFVSYLFDSLAFRRQIQRGVNGVKVYSITQTILKRLIIWLPSYIEQTAIANFLDKKTALIEQAISIKEKQIELLKERRQILIRQAVTKGLDRNVKLKDSGVEWIGEIPEGWEVKKVKHILKERNERSVNGSEPLLMMSQIHGLVVRSDYHDKAEVAQSSEGNKLVETGDLVFNKLKSHLGIFFKSTILFKGIVSPDYAVYYGTGAIPNLTYLELLFRTPEYIKQFICRATGIVEGLIRLYTGDLFDMQIAVPPKEQQLDILHFIEKASAKIATAISLKEKEIEKLKEYKASLINGAVTGKVKVC